jgi:hypothetical protein
MRAVDIPGAEYKKILEWLEGNIQDNLHADSSYYHMSAISPFIEWRSNDKETWILRVSGFKPKMQIRFKNRKHEELFSQWVATQE